MATEKKRVTFLRSLAHHMTSIQQLSFSEIGMPITTGMDQELTMGPYYSWKSDGSDEAAQRPVAPSTKEFVRRAKASKLKLPITTDLDDNYYLASGNGFILSLVFSYLMDHSNARETFTIHHDDLDLQNVLVDDEGNVTRIIDWDKSYAAPRQFQCSFATISSLAIPTASTSRHTWAGTTDIIVLSTQLQW